MRAAANRPGHGSWIWLAAAVPSATVLTGAALRYASPHCPAAAPGAAAPSAAGSGPAPGFSAAPAVSAVAVSYDPGRVAGSCLLGPFPAGGSYISLPPQ